MIVALAAIALVAVTVALFARLVREERREAARDRTAFAQERALLLDRLAHLSGKPWTPPPRVDVPRVEEPALDYIEDPEQMIEVE